jgi:endonuclease III
MLSSQTKDPITAEAIENLKAHKPDGLTVDSILSMDPKVLNGYICKVGFHNNKTRYLKETAAILKEKYDGDIPNTIEGLVGLPGVGPKMAFLCLQCAWGMYVIVLLLFFSLFGALTLISLSLLF